MKKSLFIKLITLVALIVVGGALFCVKKGLPNAVVYNIVPDTDIVKSVDGIYCDQSATTTDCSQKPDDYDSVSDVTEPEPPLLDTSKNDEHLTINNDLKEVSFCGQTYQARQVIIDGVNIVERIGEILDSNSTKFDENGDKYKNLASFCESISDNINDTNGLFINYEISDDNYDGVGYFVYIAFVPFFVDGISGDVYEVNMYEADMNIIGNLK